MSEAEFLELLKQFIPGDDATQMHHEVFADYLEERGEYNAAIVMRRHGEWFPGYTRDFFFLNEESNECYYTAVSSALDGSWVAD